MVRRLLYVLEFGLFIAAVLTVGSLAERCSYQADAAESAPPTLEEGMTYLGEFQSAKVYQGPIGHPLSGCTVLVYSLPYSFTGGYAVGCK